MMGMAARTTAPPANMEVVKKARREIWNCFSDGAF
jgi:hypothetical protein